MQENENCFKISEVSESEFQKENENLRKNLINEKKKVLDFEKKGKNNEKKVNTFDDMNGRLNKLIDDHENLLNQYEQSELIRREQTKLVKSLQNEVDILRKYSNVNDIADNSINNHIDTKIACNRDDVEMNLQPLKKKIKKKKKQSVELNNNIIIAKK